ncbi:MAG: hydantoinase/oxoprolinase family protein [Acidimicrobiia bacterium]|nr:hydantoinase/oxoprolinase family protein [Acidimicrobiia bacterium]MYB78275.1 hydantoinase/oxoprolinase family protein [Acidimicrobiia bacterium]
MEANLELRVATDIGGTFTDVVVYDPSSGRYSTAKAPSRVDDLAGGVMDALGLVVDEPRDVDSFVHGSTVGINAFLQRRGERVILLATAGAGDVYHIARGNRLDMYNIRYRKPEPLLPRRDIIPIGGRIDYQGNELAPLDHGDLRRAAERIRSEGVRSVAIAFLFSYMNPEHELTAAAALGELAPGVSLSLSHQVATEWREYERTASAVMDAYIAPPVSRYMADLSTRLADRGMPAPLRVMQSNGGIISARAASERPLQTLLSGPVGGAAGGVALAEVLSRPNLICVDLGGTSFDVSLITDGQADSSPSALLEGLPVLMPVVDIHTIGAGGGSLAYLEAGGLRVGPESAGAYPGPACYGRGGTQPTVTDANLFLGRIDPDYFLGGNLTLDTGAARAALVTLGESLDLDGDRLALGIIEVINAKMSQAIRTLTVERGIEPREFSLVAFGGAGPMHAVALAQELGIREVIVPPDPGGFSAWGMLQSAVRQDFSEAFFRDFSDLDVRDLHDRFARLGDRAVSSLLGEGVAADRIGVVQRLDMRYQGQEHTLTVTMPNGAPGARDDRFSALRRRFEDIYAARYGHSNPEASMETVNLRLTALGDVGRPLLADNYQPDQPSDSPSKTTPVLFTSGLYPTARYNRHTLPPRCAIDGPAIVEEATATTVIPPEGSATIDEYGCLIIKAPPL